VQEIHYILAAASEGGKPIGLPGIQEKGKPKDSCHIEDKVIFIDFWMGYDEERGSHLGEREVQWPDAAGAQLLIQSLGKK